MHTYIYICTYTWYIINIKMCIQIHQGDTIHTHAKGKAGMYIFVPPLATFPLNPNSSLNIDIYRHCLYLPRAEQTFG